MESAYKIKGHFEMTLCIKIFFHPFVSELILVFLHFSLFISMALSYWLRAEVDDLLSEDTFFDFSDYSCLLEDTDWA